MATVAFEKKISSEIMEFVGGSTNVVGKANSHLFFLEINPKDVNKVQISRIHRIIGVRNASINDNNVKIVLGPGKARKVTDAFNALLAIERQKNKGDVEVSHRVYHHESGILSNLMNRSLKKRSNKGGSK